jgi:hypothetical protein
MYLLNNEVGLLVEHLDNDADLAWLASNGPVTGSRPSTILRSGA